MTYIHQCNFCYLNRWLIKFDFRTISAHISNISETSIISTTFSNVACSDNHGTEESSKTRVPAFATWMIEASIAAIVNIIASSLFN
jgi:hypothetical protein